MHAYRWELALIGVCAIWGSTFVLVQDAVEVIPPFLYLFLRFALAALALAPFGAFRGLKRDETIAGIVIGGALFAGYAFQTAGLQYTSASNAGFITGLSVVITPALGALVLRKLPPHTTMIGVVLATAGLALLSLDEFRLRRGDALVLLCAVSFAAHILLIGRLGEGRSALRLAGVQIATVAILCGVWTGLFERTGVGSDVDVWVAIGITALFATALAFGVQTRAQQFIAPTRAAVIFTAEPMFAGLFGFLFAGDRLGARGYTGAALIVLGILAVELLSPAREEI